MYLIIASNNNNQKPPEEYSISYKIARFFKPNSYSPILCYIVPLSLSSSVLFPRLYTPSTHIVQSIPHIQLQMTCTFTKETTNIHQDTQGRLLSSLFQQREYWGIARRCVFLHLPLLSLLIPIAFMSRDTEKWWQWRKCRTSSSCHVVILLLPCPANVCLQVRLWIPWTFLFVLFHLSDMITPFSMASFRLNPVMQWTDERDFREQIRNKQRKLSLSLSVKLCS